MGMGETWIWASQRPLTDTEVHKEEVGTAEVVTVDEETTEIVTKEVVTFVINCI